MSIILKRRDTWIYRFSIWGLLLICSAGLFFIALLSTKMRLSGDDYCLTAVLVQEGLWGMVIRSYMEISMYNGNRYSQIFFSGLSGLSPIWGNGLLIIVSLLAWVVGLMYLVHWTARRLGLPLNLLETLVIAKSYACLVLWSTQRLDQSVIWRSSMTAYFMPMVALTWVLLLIIYTAEKNNSKWWQYAAIFLSALIAAGFSETGAALQGGFLGLAMLLILFFNKRKTGTHAFLLPVIVALCGVIMGMALMYFSPVTEMRRLSLPGTITVKELLEALAINIKVYLWYSIMRRPLVLVIPFLFGIGLGSYLFVFQSKDNNIVLANCTWKHLSLLIVLLPVVMIFLILCVMLPATYIQGSYPPDRALILAQSVLTMACILGGILTVLLIDSVVNFSKIRVLWFQNMLLGISLILILSVLVSPILMIQKNADKLRFYTRWSQLWDIRHEELVEAGKMNKDEVHVIELDHVISDVGELSPDPDYWYNNCAEMYYGVKSIYADLPGW